MEYQSGRITGRAPNPFEASIVRELTDDDLLTRKHTPLGDHARPIQKMKFLHHRLAQLLAHGTPEHEASFITGYSLSRISILKADPSFKELLAKYHEVNTVIYADLQERMMNFSLNALDEMQERLEEAPGEFTNRELLETIKVTNDRGGNSPISRSQVQVAVLSPQDIKAIKEEVKALEHGRIIEAQALPNNPRIEVGETLLGATTGTGQEATTEGQQSQGENV